MKKTIFFLLLIPSLVFSQSSQNTIDTSLFTSEYEKQVFLNYLKTSKGKPIDFLVSLDYKNTQKEVFQSEINTIIKALESNKITSKKKAKQIKEIYRYVHNSSLKKYVEEAYFNNIFEKGEYNCVTATILYALVFDHFNIDYDIKETPTHVYLIASPNENQVLIETTSPTEGLLNLDENAKKENLKFLIESKQISQEDVNSKSTDELFNEYVLTDTTINLHQLIALQYYNRGVFAFNDEQFEKSLKNFSKSYMLYKSKSTLYMINTTYANLLYQQGINKNYKGKILAQFLNLSDSYEENTQIATEYFEAVKSEWIMEHPNMDQFKLYFSDFKEWVNDSIDINDFKLGYYTSLAYYDYMNNDYEKGLENLNIAYIGNPENLRIKQMASEMASRLLFTDNAYEEGIDKMEYYFGVFPFLLDDVRFKKYYTFSYLRVIYDAFRSDNNSKGATYLDRLDGVLERDSTIELNPSFVEAVFIEISRFYIKNDNASKAISFLDRGIKLAPNSFELKDMRKHIISFKQYKSQYQPSPVEVKPISYKEYFNEHFTECWQLKEGTGNRNTKIDVQASKKVNYNYNNISKTGKWAVRYKSKLLYLVPENDEENYIIFKIVEIDEENLKLRPYVDNKLSPTTLHFTKCK